MKTKLFTFLFAIVASIGIANAEIYSGTCGDNLTWSLNTEDSTLTISGTGAMTNWISDSKVPWKSYKKQITNLVIGNNVTSIGNYAFYGSSNLMNVTIPNSVTGIGNHAFYMCSDMTSIEIPNSVTNIGNDAFYGCWKLISVSISNSVTSIGESAFSSCGKLIEINVAIDNPNYCSIDGVLFNKTQTTIIQCPGGKQGSYTIPNSVTNIGAHAFNGCSGITSIEIPNGVISIGYAAFIGCQLTSVIIPNSVISIGESAFSESGSLMSVEIGNSVTNIGNYAFYRCADITSIVIPNSVTSIGHSAFSACYGLTNIEIGNSVTNIGNNAFASCSITSITIPSSVTSIGDGAFSYCSKLSEIISMPATPPGINSNTFNKISSYHVVYVPFGSVGTYKSATYWKNMTTQCIGMNQTISTSATSCTLSFEVDDVEIASCGIEGGEMFAGKTFVHTGLNPNSNYNNMVVVLNSTEGQTERINVSFTTTALELITQASKPVSSSVAILLAQTNIADIETSCGFEYKRNDAPANMDGTKVLCPVANGTMVGRLKGLKDDVYYKYRAFYQSSVGNMYYGDWQYIFTGDLAVEFEPVLYTYAATAVTGTTATICGYALAGANDFTEQGFEYWAESRTTRGVNAPHHLPAALGEHNFVQASGISMRVTLTDLDAGTVYKYRTYAQVGEQTLYGSEMSFTTQGTYTPPTYIITFVNWDGTELQSEPVEEGVMPVYNGETPVRQEDELYTYTFSGWTLEVIVATADATYTAVYNATSKTEGFEDVMSDNTASKILQDGEILIIRGDKTYTVTGQDVK